MESARLRPYHESKRGKRNSGIGQWLNFEVEYSRTHRPMSSCRSAPSAPEGPYETQTSVAQMRGAAAPYEARALPFTASAASADVRSLARLVAALRMTSGRK